MVKEKKQFNIGDLVFAKVKGYPAWPAKITKYNNKKYNVYFYGTGETANIKVEDLFHYIENKEKFATDKNMKRNNFREAIDQIEAAANGEDSAPIDLPIIAATEGVVAADVSQAEEALENTMDESAVNNTTIDDSQLMEAVKEEEEPSAEEIVADKKVKEVKVEKDEKKTDKDVTSTPAAADATEPVSRSGRKIKVKRYIDDVGDSSNAMNAPPAKKKVSPEGISTPEPKPKAAKKNSSNANAKPMATVTPTVKSSNKSEVQNNLLLAFIPPAKCIGIKLDYQKPAMFDSPEAKRLWEEDALKEAEELKAKLEMGSIKIDAVRERIVINPSRSKIHREAKDRFTSEMIEQEDALLVERDFIQLSQQLRECLGLKRADVDRCLDILKQYKEFQLTKLMLLRNPDCVDSIRRLRRYIGNLKQWKLTEEEEIAFKAKAEIIRYEAVLIYNNFKKIFGPNTSTHFWEEFCNQVQAYKENTKHINDQNRLILTDKIYKALSNKHTKSNKADNNVEPEAKSVKEEVGKENDDTKKEEDKTDKLVEQEQTVKAMETDEVVAEQEETATLNEEDTPVDNPSNTDIAVEAN
ncbi:PC4 and SFRS1-interacting protein [Lucilia sericata]|uniref:PC4 and SFRS1-interacting protein n=1 Tax=Lucilia sericata TaxID=13632 RepID=UPI0018A882B1|nr:PC4 and SFRS1-interacting protein [Lucilia sericata]